MSIFSSIRVRKPKRTAFDLSHEVKLTCDFGELVPFFCQDVIPGDTFKVSVETFVRFAPLIAPVMHRVNVFTHFFFVPYRLVWDEWREFITGGEDGSAAPVFPRVSMSGVHGPSNDLGIGSLADYLGVPVGNGTASSSSNLKINLLPFRAYQLIWNEYYRDQNLQDEIDFSLASGIFVGSAYNGDSSNPNIHGCRECLQLRNRCWEKDYFTSALPFPQRFPSPVTVPVNGTVDILMKNTGRPGVFQSLDGTELVQGSSVSVKNSNGNGQSQIFAGEKQVQYNPNNTLFGQFNDSSNITINELRRAFSLQRWLENNARAGSRYIEQILSHFGVRSSDARLQRPEYLGGGKSPVVISEVLQTSETANSPQGNMAGNATSYGVSHSFKRFFEEHGIVLGILSILPRSNYQDGLPKLFGKFDKFDYYFPEFAHLGEQEIKHYEAYCDLSKSLEDSANSKLFGYTPRYAEYRFVNSSVHGFFRTDLNFWHLGRVFSKTNQPALNGSFVEVRAGNSSTGLNRIFAVEDTSYDRLWIQMYVKFLALRPLPKYGTPGL